MNGTYNNIYLWSFYIYENGTPQQLNRPQTYRVNDSEKDWL